MKYTEITSHAIACELLKRDPNAMPDVSMRPANQQAAIIGIIQLMDIAEAINQADGHTIDWNDTDQEKWYPFFDGAAGFGFSISSCGCWSSITGVGSRLCFRTEEISDFFGQQFNELHKQVLTLNP